MFLLPELTAQVEYHLYRISQNMIIEAQTAFYVADDSDEQFEMSHLDGYFDGVNMVYEDDHFESERRYFTGVIKGAHFWPLLDTNFKDKAQAQQTFWIDVMSLQQDAITDGAYWPYLKPEECHGCGRSPWNDKDTDPLRSTHWTTLKLVKGKCQATCNDCEEAEKVWSEVSKWEEEKRRELPPVAEEEEGATEEGTSNSSKSEDSEDDGLMSARNNRDQEQEKGRKKLEWLLKVGGTAIFSETRMAFWKKVDEMRQAAQG